jgi:hypothetical protein
VRKTTMRSSAISYPRAFSVETTKTQSNAMASSIVRSTMSGRRRTTTWWAAAKSSNAMTTPAAAPGMSPF